MEFNLRQKRVLRSSLKQNALAFVCLTALVIYAFVSPKAGYHPVALTLTILGYISWVIVTASLIINEIKAVR